MASRNERKRLAKARAAELKVAVEQAFAVEQEKKRVIDAVKASYVAKTQDALRFHRNPSNRAGKVVQGKFVPALASKEPEKRKLVLNKLTGKMIERRKTYI